MTKSHENINCCYKKSQPAESQETVNLCYKTSLPSERSNKNVNLFDKKSQTSVKEFTKPKISLIKSHKRV